MANDKILGSILLLAAATFGCKTVTPAGRQVGYGNSGSVIASVPGMDDGDQDRIADIEYILFCDQKEPVKGEVLKRQEADLVSFTNEKLANGDECALEIRGSNQSEEDFIWNSAPKTPGLFYGSNKGKIANNQLKLTLYKLYHRKSKDDLKLKVDAEMILSDSNLKSEEMSASLLCEGSSVSANLVSFNASSVSIDFVASASSLEGKSCESVVIMVNNGKKSSYSAQVENSPFTGLAAGGEFVIKTSKFEKQSLGIDTEFIAGGACFQGFDTSTRECKDRRYYKFNYKVNAFMAKVNGFTPNGSRRSFTVTSREPLEAVSIEGLSINDLNRNRNEFSFYPADRAGAILRRTFTNFDQMEELQNPIALINIADIAIVDIEIVYAHEFHKANEAAIYEKSGTVYWLAHVKSTDDALNGEFVISGSNENFMSSKREKSDLFTYNMIKADTEIDAGEFKAYSFEGQLFHQPTCDYSLQSVMNEYNSLSLEKFVEPNTELDKCKFDLDVSDLIDMEGEFSVLDFFVKDWASY